MRELNLALAERAAAALRDVIHSLRRDGGSMTPSVYETAQVLRFCPEYVEADKVLEWLLHCQQSDGGWEDPASPIYRDVPTLAALLALQSCGPQPRVREAIYAAQRFLEEQTTVVAPADGEYLPVGMELVLPCLLDQAEESGFSVDRTRFQYVEEIGAQRSRMLAKHPPAPNSPPVFSWEAWGSQPDAELVGAAGVGHNPAATAWWLHLDRGRTPTPARSRAKDAIRQASRAAGGGAVGIVPDAWPMDRFEQSLVLHLVASHGLLHHDQLGGVMAAQLEDIRRGLTRCGLGFSDEFEADGDDTAAAVAALAMAGLPVDYRVLDGFAREDRCVSYPFEVHGSHTVTARATHAFRIIGCDMEEWRPYILQAQRPDGWWTGDKWNRSRLYGTWIALIGLPDDTEAVRSAARAFFAYQHADGGWGCFGRSTTVETAFGVLSLCHIAERSGYERECAEAITAGHRYLRRSYSGRRVGSDHMWICKDLYSARRIDHAAILSALIAPSLPAHRHLLGDRRRAAYRRLTEAQ